MTASPAAPGTAPGGGAQEAATPGQAARKAWGEHWAAATRRGRGKPGYDSLAYEAEAWEVAAEAGAKDWALKAAQACNERDAAREELATCRERNAAIAVQLDQYRDERDAARDHAGSLGLACHDLAVASSMQLRTLMAALIDLQRGDAAAATETIVQWTENIPDLEPWNGHETGTEWLERVGDGSEAAP